MSLLLLFRGSGLAPPPPTFSDVSVLIGLINHAYSSTVTAGSEESGLPATNLQNDIGDASTAWQSLDGDLSAADGAVVTITPATAKVWRAFAATRTNLTATGTMTVKLYNNPSTLVWTGTSLTPEPGYGQLIIVADQDYTTDYCVIEFNDPANPDNHINVPLIFAGQAWIPAVGMSWDSALGRTSVTDSRQSRGGQIYPTPRYQARFWQVDFKAIQGDELWDDAQELDRISRFQRNILFVPDVTSDKINNEAVFGIVESPANVTFISGIVGLYAWQFKITERL